MGRMNTYKSLPMYEFAVMRVDGCDVSSLWAAGNMEVEVLQRYHEQFCKAYRGAHLLFSVPKISSRGLVAYRLHFHRESSYLVSNE